MNRVVNKFVLAHDRYLELDRIRTECTSPAQRESIHIAIMTAYLEVQHHARPAHPAARHGHHLFLLSFVVVLFFRYFFQAFENRFPVFGGVFFFFFRQDVVLHQAYLCFPVFIL